MATRSGDEIMLADAPAIPGLQFRRFRGDSDYPAMAEVLNASLNADGTQQIYSTEQVVAIYAPGEHFDPARQAIFAEIDGEMIGFARTLWKETPGTGRVYTHSGFLRPEWRRRGIGTAMLCFIHGIPAALGDSATVTYESLAWDQEIGTQHLLEHNGYQPRVSSVLMVRPTLDNIPDAALPPGVEVRPVQETQWQTIFDAEAEAFRDYSFFVPTLDRITTEARHHGTSLWQIAWQADQVVGMVRAFINHEENQTFGWKRGYTEYISVRAPWRGKGIAKALITRSLAALKAAGMAEAALTVNTENPTGAFQLYKSLGYEIVKRRQFYRKSS
jgi:mycothiol synthase